MPSRLASATPEGVDRWSFRLVGSALVLAICFLLLLVWGQPVWVMALPGALVGGMLVVFAAGRPLLHLCLVLSGFVFTIAYTEAIGLSEIIYGLYYLTFLGCWYIYHVYLQREQLLRLAEDRVLVLFVCYATGTLALTYVFGGALGQGFREWLPLTWFGFYFPIKKYVAEHDRAANALLVVFAWLVVFILIRNMIQYQQILSSAEQAYRVMQGRVRMNERVLMLGAFGALALMLYTSRISLKGLLLGGFLACLGGIIIGQSRALWVSFALGIGVMFLLTDTSRKLQLLTLGAVGFGGVLAIGALVFDNLFTLIFRGLVNRFASLITELTTDTSLANRFYEWGAVLDSAKNSPILGHGFGVDYEYYSLVYRTTAEKSHIHSTYLAILYRHGMVGVVLMFFFWIRSLIRGIRLLHFPNLRPSHRAIGTMATAGLVALLLAATTESILTVSDGVFIIMFPTALISGLWERYASDPS